MSVSPSSAGDPLPRSRPRPHRGLAGRRGCGHAVVQEDGFELVRLSSQGGLDAAFSPSVGMTCCSLRDDGDELLGARHGLSAYAGRGITMGLSLLHPWAGRLPSWRYHALGETVRLPVSPRLHTDGSGLPVNGVQNGAHAWQLDHLDADAYAARLDATLPFDRDPRQLELFPFPHRVHVHAELAERTLTIATTVEATGGIPVPVCFGYRAYLRLDPRCDHTTVALPSRRWIETDHRRLPTGASHPLGATVHWLGSAPLDEVFALGTGRRLTVASGERGTTLEPREGFRFARVSAAGGEPDVVLEALTAEPAGLSHDAFEVATPGRPYRTLLRLSTSAARPRAIRAAVAGVAA